VPGKRGSSFAGKSDKFSTSFPAPIHEFIWRSNEALAPPKRKRVSFAAALDGAVDKMLVLVKWDVFVALLSGLVARAI
jgi:hypothetical protein